MRLRSIYSAAVCVAGIAVFSATPAHAQDPRTPLPSDTARILRGYTDFSRYYTPGMCYATVQSLKVRIQRSWARDTMSSAAELLSPLPPIAVETGKRCAARFTIANTDPLELENLQLLALAIGDDSLARLAVQRRLTLARTLQDSANVLEHSVSALIEAAPARREEAKATLVRLEQLGASVGKAAVRAHISVLRRLAGFFDAPVQKQLAASAIAVSGKLSMSDRDEIPGDIQWAWIQYMQAVMFESPDSAAIAGGRMMQDMSTIRGGTYRDFSAPFREVFAAEIFPRLGQPLANFDTEANYLIPSVPSAELRMGELPRGDVHLVISTDEVDARLHGLIRRMQDKYGKQGLSVVVVSGTKGFTRWNASGVLTPAEEAESLRTLMVDHLKLPVTFVVEDVPFRTIPDGRKVYGRTQWHTRLPAAASLIGRNGNLVMGFLWVGESEIEAYIERALKSPAERSTRIQATAPVPAH